MNQGYTHSEPRKGIPVIHPSKESQHTFRVQSSSYNLYKLTAFHSILGDSTIHGKKNCTTFLLIHWKRSCHSHNQTAKLIQIRYSTTFTFDLSKLTVQPNLFAAADNAFSWFWSPITVQTSRVRSSAKSKINSSISAALHCAVCVCCDAALRSLCLLWCCTVYSLCLLWYCLLYCARGTVTTCEQYAPAS